jgi:hypothetical protein
MSEFVEMYSMVITFTVRQLLCHTYHSVSLKYLQCKVEVGSNKVAKVVRSKSLNLKREMREEAMNLDVMVIGKE